MKVTFAFRNFENASKITEDKKLKAEINPTLQQMSYYVICSMPPVRGRAVG
jgi:hypothetical protein